MSFNRNLKYSKDGAAPAPSLLTIEGPLPADPGWQTAGAKVIYRFRCSNPPSEMEIPGFDDMEALYLCLSAVKLFFESMLEKGHDVFHASPGDCGGFR